jgi:hypothetical protein
LIKAHSRREVARGAIETDVTEVDLRPRSHEAYFLVTAVERAVPSP